MGLGLSNGGGRGGPSRRSGAVPSGSTGVVYTVSKLLGSTSTISLITGTDTNLTGSGASISAATAPADGTTQTAIVREVNGGVAVEYPLGLTWQAVSGGGGGAVSSSDAFISDPSFSGVVGPGQTLTATSGTLKSGWTTTQFVWGRGEGVGAPVSTGSSRTLGAALSEDDTRDQWLTQEVQDGSGNKDARTIWLGKFDTTFVTSFDFSTYDDNKKIAEKYVASYNGSGAITGYTTPAGQNGIPGWFMIGDVNGHGGLDVMDDQIVLSGVQHTNGSSNGRGLCYDTGLTDFAVTLTLGSGGVINWLGFNPKAPGDSSSWVVDRSFNVSKDVPYQGDRWDGLMAAQTLDGSAINDGKKQYRIELDQTNLITAIKIDGVLRAANSIAPLSYTNGIFGLRYDPTTRSGIAKIQVNKLAAAAIKILSASIIEVGDTAKSQKCEIHGVFAGTTPASFKIKVKTPKGLLAMDWETAEVVSITGNQFVIRSVTPFPVSLEGKRPTIIVARGDDLTIASSTTAIRLGYRTYKRQQYVNLTPLEPDLAGNAVFRDWHQMGRWQIDDFGNPMDGMNSFVNYDTLLQAGIIDRYNRVISYPATGTIKWIPYYETPDASELGDRMFVLPPNQGFSVQHPNYGSDPIGLTVSADFYGSGKHKFSFAGGTLARGLVNFSITLDRATFQSQASTPVSFRLASDTTNLVFTDLFKNTVKHWAGARLMDWMYANEGGAWAETFETRRLWGFFCPEVLIALANEVTAAKGAPFSLWFVIGANALEGPANVKKYFLMMEAGLDPSIKEYFVETANEPWNLSFTTTRNKLITRACANRRFLGEGYGDPADLAPIHLYPNYSSFTGPDTPVPAGEYYTRLMGEGYPLYKAKVLTSATPTPGASDANWEYKGNCGVTYAWELGVMSYDMAETIGTDCPRLVWGGNAARGDGGFAPMSETMKFPKTKGGTDFFAKHAAFWAVAPYEMIWSDSPTWQNQPAGQLRVQALNTHFATYGLPQATACVDARAKWKAVLDATGQYDKPPRVFYYEGGVDTPQDRPDPLALDIAIDMMDWYYGRSPYSNLYSMHRQYIDHAFYPPGNENEGVEIQAAYIFGVTKPQTLQPADTFTAFNNTYCFLQYMGDLTSAIPAAEVERAAYYESL